MVVTCDVLDRFSLLIALREVRSLRSGLSPCRSRCPSAGGLPFESMMDHPVTSHAHFVGPTASSSPDMKVPSILIVDDHPANLLAFEAVLGPLRHRIVPASPGQEALQQLRRGDLSLVLLALKL